MDKLKRQELIIGMVKSGKTYSETGKKFGISKQRVQQIIVKEYFVPHLDYCRVCKSNFLKEWPNHFLCVKCVLNGKMFQGRERTREMVRRRDDYTCQKCGKIWNDDMRRFDVHHLRGNCGKLTYNYDSVKDMSGMITYCHKCHLGLHSNIKKFRNPRRLTDRKKTLIKKLIKSGMKTHQIAKKLNLAYPTVFNYKSSHPKK